MNLSEHFTLEELVASQIAARRRIDNRPPAAVIENLRRVAAVLEQVRALVGRPITVSSGYRSPALNAAAGGARESAHLLGLAADITVSGLTPKDLAKAIAKAGIEFDQLILEFDQWVHVGITNGEMRQQVLTAKNSDNGTVYIVGIQ